MTQRQKRSKVKKAWARCRNCSWVNLSSGAIGAAAQHHDSTGHTVECEQTVNVVYGNPRMHGRLSVRRSTAAR